MSAGRSEEDDADDGVSSATPGTQRLDKWLWFVRVIKSRTLAAGLVADGKVRVNKDKVLKPSHAVRPGDVLTVRVGERVRILKVLGPGVRRGPASEAQTLFEDLTPPPQPQGSAPTGGAMPQRQPGAGRPTKRDRRQLDRFHGDGET